MRSRFSINGHPFHPMLVTVPIGLFVWAFVADIVYLATGAPEWYDIAFWSGIAAVLTALVAALPGFADYFTIGMRTKARNIGLMHMVLNLAVVAVYAIAAWLMQDRAAAEGGMLTTVVVLHGVGTALLTISGILGGEMVYRHHLAVIPDDADAARQEQQRHEERTQRRAA